MRKIPVLLLVLSLVFGVSMISCGPKRANSSKDAITIAKAIENVKEKSDYLVSQANAFYNSKEFQQAIDISQYVLRYVDKNSQETKNILEKAKEALAKQLQEIAADAKKKISGFGK